MYNLFIVRGVSGSSKTTAAKAMTENVVSADDYFYDEDGKYKWNPRKIDDAHKWCFDTTQEFMNLGVDVAVANTFTRKWEFENYLVLAERYGYTAHVMTIENYHGGTNVHNVPEETLNAMENRFEIKLR